MKSVVLSGTGLYHPSEFISNEELVHAFNQYVANYNKTNAEKIERGELLALEESSTSFIEKASGIKGRFVMNKTGILDPQIMKPTLKKRLPEELSYQAEMALHAAKEAMQKAEKNSKDIQAIIVACSNLERPYPALAVEIQEALQIGGFAFDMNVACSSATFAIGLAHDLIKAGTVSTVLIVNPEICSAHLNFKDRDNHFIFGDACTALIVESSETASSSETFQILGTKLKTQYSNNIRNNMGFLQRTFQDSWEAPDLLFRQQGRKVFKEVTPLVSSIILEHLKELNLTPQQFKKLWLHQANANMNRFICEKILGREPLPHEAPLVLDRFANTSSAGSIISFHLHHSDMISQDLGLICSFGAGYSVGNIVIQKI